MSDRSKRNPRPCRMCGAPTTSWTGYCSRTPQCHNEAMCVRKGYTTRLRCAGCGGPMRSHCKWRFCMRNPQCRSLRNAEMRRVDPERLRANARRHAAKHAQANRDRSLVQRRVRGVGPPRRGQHSPQWAGGRIVFCDICGRCAGWRNPSQLRRRKRFFCADHARGKSGRIVSCYVCGRPAGWRRPSRIKATKRFFCREHRDEKWNWRRHDQSERAVRGVSEAGGDRAALRDSGPAES